MAIINLDTFSPSEQRLLQRIIKKDGTVRESKPELDETGESRYAAYVWRQIVFYASEKRAHQCMPVMCFYELPEYNRDKVVEALEELVTKVLKQIPLSELPGLRAWAKVMF